MAGINTQTVSGFIAALAVFISTSGLVSCTPAEKPLHEGRHENSGDEELFNGLSERNITWQKASPDYIIRFPDDHLSHPQHAIEWWYLTANLTSKNGVEYGVQWTLFRFADEQAAPPWADNQLYMAHAKLISKEKSWFSERFARGDVGNAGVSGYPFTAFLDDWVWQGKEAYLVPATLTFSADDGISVSLNLSRSGPYIKHGESGYSVKVPANYLQPELNGQGPSVGDEIASHYYSLPFIDIRGLLTVDGQNIRVDGQGWFDHEWTSQYLSEGAEGWDWFSLHLEGGAKLMLFNVRLRNVPDFWSGTLVTAAGDIHHLDASLIDAEPSHYQTVRRRPLPLNWRLRLPRFGIDIRVSPLKPDQWNQGRFSYYEGVVLVNGSHTGRGFIELSGYQQK